MRNDLVKRNEIMESLANEYCRKRALVVITADLYRMFTLGNYCVKEENRQA